MWPDAVRASRRRLRRTRKRHRPRTTIASATMTRIGSTIATNDIADAGTVLDRAHDRRADSERRDVDDRPGGGLHGVHDQRDDDAGDDRHPLVAAEERARVAAPSRSDDWTSRRTPGRRRSAGRTVCTTSLTAVERRHLVGDDLDREQHAEDAPASSRWTATASRGGSVIRLVNRSSRPIISSGM